MNQKVMIVGVFFLFVFLFGFWLSRAGKPYNTMIFTVHKLIGLAMGVYLIMTVYQAHRADLFGSLDFLVLALTVIIFIGLVAAGGLLSVRASGGLGNINPAMLTAITVVHKVFPYFAVLSTAATLYLLLFRKG